MSLPAFDVLLNQTTTTTQSLLPPVELEHLLDHELWLTGLRLALKLLVVAAAANQARTRSLVHDGALLVKASLNFAAFDLVRGWTDCRVVPVQIGVLIGRKLDPLVRDGFCLDWTFVPWTTEAVDRLLLAFGDRWGTGLLK